MEKTSQSGVLTRHEAVKAINEFDRVNWWQYLIFFKILYDGTILDLSGIKRAREINLYDVWGELNNYNRELLQDVKKSFLFALKSH